MQIRNGHRIQINRQSSVRPPAGKAASQQHGAPGSRAVAVCSIQLQDADRDPYHLASLGDSLSTTPSLPESLPARASAIEPHKNACIAGRMALCFAVLRLPSDPSTMRSCASFLGALTSRGSFRSPMPPPDAPTSFFVKFAGAAIANVLQCGLVASKKLNKSRSAGVSGPAAPCHGRSRRPGGCSAEPICW